MLCKLLYQFKGLECDVWDVMVYYQMVVDEEGNLVVVGWLYINVENEVFICFMVVYFLVQDKGLGMLMVMILEFVVCQEGVKWVICSVCEDVVEFFVKFGFVNQGEIIILIIMLICYFLMIKLVVLLDDILYCGDWCVQFQQVWYQYILLSEKMGVCIQQYIGQKFIIIMLEVGNQNLYYMLFVGSLFLFVILIGWGFIWLMLCEWYLGGIIILVDVYICYSQFISGCFSVIVDFGFLSGDFD